MAVARSTQQLLDGATHPGAATRLPAAALAVTLTLVGVLPFPAQYARSQLRRSVAPMVQDRVFAAVNGLPGLTELEEPGFQDHLRLAVQAAQAAPHQVIQGVFAFGQSLVTLAGFLAVLIPLDPRLGALAALASVPAFIAEMRVSTGRAQLTWSMSPHERRKLFYLGLQTDPRAAKEVRLFGLDGFLRGRMRRELTRIGAAERQVDRQELRLQLGTSMSTGIITAAAILLTAARASSGAISPGQVVVVVAAFTASQVATVNAVREISHAQQSLLMIDHYVTVLRICRSATATRSDQEEAPQLDYAVELRDVWFRYHEDSPWVLAGVNLTLPASRTVALVGVNGAGKSTLVKLICGLYTPTRGTMLWNGVDMATLEPAAVRRRISTLFQDFMTYDLTAAENIGVGDIERVHDRESVRRAALAADVDAAINSLPRGYDTLLSLTLGDATDGDGASLSGGQWQRLATARALMRTDAELLILDEPSAGLDAAAEHELHERLASLRAGKTSLLISHRLSAVRDADIIAVLDHGRIIETGTHAQLMQRASSTYRHLFQLQAKGYSDRPPGATQP